MMEPYTFVATIFIEPILFQMKASTEALARLTLKRRDSWNSKCVQRICKQIVPELMEKGRRCSCICKESRLSGLGQKAIAGVHCECRYATLHTNLC